MRLLQLPFGGQPDKFPLETCSDEKGRFRFERPDTDKWKRRTAVFLIAQKEGLALGWKELQAPQDTILRLSMPDQFSGKVVDQKGNSVSDAQVEIAALRVGEKYISSNKVPDILTVSTDDQGSFSFKNLPVSG